MQPILSPNDEVWEKNRYKKFVMDEYKYKDLTQEKILKNWEILETKLIELATKKDKWMSNLFNIETNKEQLDSNIDWEKVPTLKQLGIEPSSDTDKRRKTESARNGRGTNHII
jgi:hypothetical protein